MKRLTGKTLAIVTGLVLGWQMAGLIPSSPVIEQSYAQEQHARPQGTESHDPSHNADERHHDHGDESMPSPPPSEGAHLQDVHQDTHIDPGQRTAAELIPQDEDYGWYRPVVQAVVGLFAAAVLLGVPALRLRGPELPEPAHDDQHHDPTHSQPDQPQPHPRPSSGHSH